MENKRKVHWSAWDNLTMPKGKGGLDFRDMALFNQALLARQAWRLIQRPNSLCARVLKARYFPNGSLLDTVFASDPSPAWKGIEYELELLKIGMIKRIGDGCKTQITRDNWIPRDNGLKTIALKKNSRRRWVNQLITPDMREWNHGLLRELLHDADVEAILQIPIPRSQTEDRWAWHYERNGQFTVKSAYRLAYNLKHRDHGDQGSSSNPSGERKLWNNIWQADVPPKVRIFSWRVVSDNLATQKNKWKRTLELSDRCPVCGCTSEDAFHATVSCTKALALRHAMGSHWPLPAENCFRDTGKDWLLLLLSNCDKTTRARTLLVLWRSWYLRNDIVHEKGTATIGDSVSFLLAMQHSYSMPPAKVHDSKLKNVAVAVPAASVAQPDTASRWTTPPHGWIKVNTDGSFRAASMTGGTGAVIRDEHGHVLLAAHSFLSNCSQAEEAEARALILGLKLAFNEGYAKIILETDCSLAATALRSSATDRSPLFFLYEEARLLIKNFQDCSVLWIGRSANCLADGLAKMAYSEGDGIMRNDLNATLRELALNDRYTGTIL